MVFSATGDAPYGEAEVAVFQQILDAHNRYSPSSFLVHVGDILTGGDPCAEFQYERMAGMLETLAVPAFILPGDNETTDCLDPAQGWAYWQKHLLGIEQRFCGTPPVERQLVRPENFAFTLDGVLFVGIHLVGGSNDQTLMQDDADWVGAQLQAKGASVRAAVVLGQGPPGGSRDYFFDRFEQHATGFGKPVLYIHGDGHGWIQDSPFAATNMLRVQLDRGDEPPVQVTVTLDAQNPFQFLRDPWPSGTPLLNHAPCVDAGPNKTLAGPGTLTLQGLVKDDGLPSGTLMVQWRMLSGPAAVSFASPGATSTEATFPQTGSYVLRLSASDGTLTGNDDVQVSVGTQPNRTPIARDDAYTTAEDVRLSAGTPGVLQNDSDPDGDLLTASILDRPLHGTLGLAADGAFSYTPAPNFYGGDSFTYTISDARGGTATASVALTITPVNDAPVAVDDSFYVRPAQTLDVAAPGVLGNDSDVDGDALRLALLSPAAHGALDFHVDGSFTYVPAFDFAGWDSFTYRVSDAAGASAIGTVTIGVGIHRFTPIADASVRENWNKNLGTDPSLELRSGPQIYRSYLKFDVNGMGDVRSALLRIYITSSSVDPVSLHAVSNLYNGSNTEWTEGGILWSNAPPIATPALGTASGQGNGTWVVLDVSAAVRGNALVSFALQTGSRRILQFSSREGGHAPELLVAELPKTSSTGDIPTGEGTPGDGLRVRRLASTAGWWIEYALPRPTHVDIALYNVRGQRVRRLFDGLQDGGKKQLLWDGLDDAKGRAPSGVYFLRLQLDARRLTHKLLVQR